MHASVDSSQTVLVGYDGSRDSSHVLTTAARAATGRGLPLTVLALAQGWLGHAECLADVRPTEQAALRQAGDAVDRAVAELCRQWPDLSVRSQVTMAPEELRDSELAREASLLVLGRTGHWGRRVLTWAAPSAMLARVLSCSVLVPAPVPALVPALVPAKDDSSGLGKNGVVVGLKANAVEPALVVAADEARRRRAALTLVHSLPGPTPAGTHGPVHAKDCRRGWDGATERQVWSWVTEQPHDHAVLHGLACELHLVVGDPVDALVDHAERDSLLVVGAHGRDSLVSAAVGSVGRGLLDRAPCEVLIAR